MNFKTTFKHGMVVSLSVLLPNWPRSNGSMVMSPITFPPSISSLLKTFLLLRIGILTVNFLRNCYLKSTCTLKLSTKRTLLSPLKVSWTSWIPTSVLSWLGHLSTILLYKSFLEMKTILFMTSSFLWAMLQSSKNISSTLLLNKSLEVFIFKRLLKIYSMVIRIYILWRSLLGNKLMVVNLGLTFTERS